MTDDDEHMVEDFECLMRLQDNDHNRDTVEIGDKLNTNGGLTMRVEHVVAVNEVLYLFGSLVDAPKSIDGFAASAPGVEA